MSVEILTLHKARYISASFAEVILALKNLLKQSRKQALKFREKAERNFTSDLIQRSWIRSHKDAVVYSRLLAYLKANPKDYPKVLGVLSVKTLSGRLRVLRKMGIDADSYLPGEGMYKSPDSREKQPSSPAYPFLRMKEHG